jgi:hypothetical protein
MNTINVSSGFSPFQLHMGHSPCLIPPIAPALAEEASSDVDTALALALIKCITLDIKEAKDNLLAAKVAQAEFANRHRGDEIVYSVGDKVMLSTIHRCREYMQKNSDRVAKFMPRFDGPFLMIKAFPEKSIYTLELPNEPNRFPTFHASLL